MKADQAPYGLRITNCNAAAVCADGEFVLYWMIAFRRTHWNLALERAVAWAVEVNRPLVILEPLRIGYRWASDRIHRFILDGMADNLAGSPGCEIRAYFIIPTSRPSPTSAKDCSRRSPNGPVSS